MYRFIKYIIVFLNISLIGYVVSYYLVDIILNTYNNDDKIFIWGDSQTCQGININELRNLTNKTILSAARHGAGVYDFLVFTEKVPNKSNVIVAISEPVQLRKKNTDRNDSGVTIKSLKLLYHNDYTLTEIINIIKNNRMPSNLFTSESKLYPYADSVKITESSLSFFHNFYKTIPSYLKDKQKLYTLGIENLIMKNCKIVFIKFPYHSILSEIESKSDLKDNSENFINRLMKLFGESYIDSISLTGPKELMHDLTHLNEYGATKLTDSLSRKIILNKNLPTTFFIVKINKAI